MNYAIFDIETDGFDSTKIHCLSYEGWYNGVLEEGTLTNYADMGKFAKRYDKYIGHNIIQFDIPVIEQFTKVKIPHEKCVDTLSLSWWLFPNRIKHGLDSWGETVGIKKPEVEDWENLSLETYIERCEEDVKINSRVFQIIMKKLKELYGDDKETVGKVIQYASFKMWTLRLAAKSPFILDFHKVDRILNRMEVLLEQKRERLIEVMPKVPVRKDFKYPSKMFKKDGDPTVARVKWLNFLMMKGLPLDHKEDIPYIKKYDAPNPNSTQQKKAWLFSLGWKPLTFKYERDDEGNTRKIPQLRDGKKLCKSINLLADKNEVVKELEGYSVLGSRTGVLKKFLKDAAEDGSIIAGAAGFTNTMRLKHRTLVNLPGVTEKNDFADGVWVRGCLGLKKGRVMCGSDISSLEDKCKQHYMFPHDPKFVEEMNGADYDPHISVGITANLITLEEAEFFKVHKELEKKDKELLTLEEKVMLKKLKSISTVRKASKIVNFSSVYGIGAKKLSLTLGCTVKHAKKLLEAYWKKNWAVKRVASEQLVITLGDASMWLRNPLNGFYYSLRYEKDIFSVLNQGSGVYVFDTWMKHILKVRPQLTAQFHDEIVLDIKGGAKDLCDNLLQKAMDETNEELKLNVKIEIDTKYGLNYADVH